MASDGSNAKDLPDDLVNGTACEAEFAAVVFHDVFDCYAPEQDIECRYTTKASVKPTKKDWVGLFKVGWQSSREHFTYEWSPYIEQNADADESKAMANRVLFKARYLPKADDEFYQFCYVNSSGDVRGASVPFQIKTKCEYGSFECFEMEDEDGMLLVKDRTAILEDSLGRALEENAVLKASKERYEGDVKDLNETIMELEARKSALMSEISSLQKQCYAYKTEAQEKSRCLENNTRNLDEEKQRRAELEKKVADLETSKQELMELLEHANRKIEELVILLEQEKMQSSEVQKTREKLVSEKLQFLQNIASNRELADKLTVDLNAKEQEVKMLEAKMVEERESYKNEIDALKNYLDKSQGRVESCEEELKQSNDVLAQMKLNAETGAQNTSQKLQTSAKILEAKEKEVVFLTQKIDAHIVKISSLEQERDQAKEEAAIEVSGLEDKLKTLLEENIGKQELIHRLENELEDMKAHYDIEKGKCTALEEDYENVLRNIENQLEGERALNKSLCSQSDRNVTELQDQLADQLEVNRHLAHDLEARNAQIKYFQEEIEQQRKQLQSCEDKMKVAYAQVTAADAEVKGLKSAKETMQQTLDESKGANVKSSKNSAASMYALQTAHTHLEKKYFKMKKELEEMWRERNELKRSLATLQGNLPQGDLRHEIEDLRAKNEDLRVRLNMGAEAYKIKFIECRKLQSQIKRLHKTPSVECMSEGMGNADIHSAVSKLKQSLDEEKAATMVTRKALDLEKDMVLKKNQEIEQANQEILELKIKLETPEPEQQQQTSSEQPGPYSVAELRLQIEELEQEVEVRSTRVADMELLFQTEKADKQNLIEEIVNLQEQLRTCEEERSMCKEDVVKLQQDLEQEQTERDRLGVMARERIAELENTLQEARGEVDRWKKEVNMYVAAETKMIGNKDDDEAEPQPPASPPYVPPQPPHVPPQPPHGSPQPPHIPPQPPHIPPHGSPQSPQDTRQQFQWPWHRNWQANWRPVPHGSPPLYGTQQPWVMVQRNDVPPQEVPASAFPQDIPQSPSAPAPQNSGQTDRECPVCRILFPPGMEIESIQEHVNSHFDRCPP